MANQARGVHSIRKNLTKAEITARETAEELVVTNQTKPKADETTKNHSIMRKLFNKLKNLNDHFTEADSIALNTLVFNLYMKQRSQEKLITTDELDDNFSRLLINLEKFNKQINESMKQLCIPLNARMSLANDMAKVMIEEKKLEAMEAPKVKEVNPLLAILEDDDDE
ncbi:hypothetical protein CN692_14255 [Bacillus sp. AFS002410]|uniref:hypothetical protein n=1 Tax=Bacillus sp. AFS002410 TaxID=2033481 RepID=UPI000BF0CF83|nr:hypothetical protein [Bacillus sp. AFS002410]PEJ57057.1 hypothetical protein CN692_14255 [Bacillus sp. AFS002410]